MAYSSSTDNYYKTFGKSADTTLHISKLESCATSGNKFYYDDTSVSIPAGTRRNEPVRLFAAINGYGPAYGKIYYIKFFENGVLIRDYIPVKVNGVGYMYDKVSGQLFGNSGTGTFIMGPATGEIIDTESGKPKVSSIRRKMLQLMPKNRS